MQRRRRLRVGIDTGGTFTDLVVVDRDSGDRRTHKVLSTPARPSLAVFEAIEQAELDPAEIELFVLGTTIATNCLIQRRGQRTLHLTTAGFEDVPFIQRIDRKSLYDLQWAKPVPYVLRRDCHGVRERVLADGTIEVALEQEEIDRLLALVAAADAAEPDGVAVAISLLFSYLTPGHERSLAAALREQLPEVPVSASSEVAPIWREYERGNTAIVDAYLRRLTSEFAAEIAAGLEARGIDGHRFFLKSNGGQVPCDAAGERPVQLVISGLAGGMIGGRHFAAAAGSEKVVTLDMGGTSADVGIVEAGDIRIGSSYEFEWGLPIAIPAVDIETIGAGGSSIAGFDQGGLLHVGPESAGADPGPAAYGRGGDRATVTDANVVLGRLNPGYFLGGGLQLDAELAAAAVGEIAAGLDCSVERAAEAIVDMAVVNMANAIRLLCADRGLDHHEFALMVFGGAGPLHAGQLMRVLGIRELIVPPHPGLISAFGAQASDLRVDRRVTRPIRTDVGDPDELRTAVAELAETALAELRGHGASSAAEVSVIASARYLGQNFEADVVVPRGDEDPIAAVIERFHAGHAERYGYRLDSEVVEIVHLTAVAVDRRERSAGGAELSSEPGRPVAERSVRFDGEAVRTPIYRRAELGLGQAIDGPAIVEEVDSTTVVLAGQRARVAPSGALHVDALAVVEEPDLEVEHAHA